MVVRVKGQMVAFIQRRIAVAVIDIRRVDYLIITVILQRCAAEAAAEYRDRLCI